MAMYTIRSTSDEGVYYLVNGWNKHKTFWVELSDLNEEMLFSRPRFAKASLTKLLKVMSDYKTDYFQLVEFNEKMIPVVIPVCMI